MKRRSLLSIHYAWVVLFLTFLTIVTAAGIRSTATVFINPLKLDFGWTRATISSAISLNLFMFGVAAPVSGYLIYRFGSRMVMLVSMVVLSVGIAGTLIMTSFWQFLLLWGVVVGLSTGALGSVISATVANLWFERQRGLALGILSSAQSTGQMLFIPLVTAVLLAYSWQVGSLVMVGIVVMMFVLIALGMRNDPSDVNMFPYGSVAPAKTEVGTKSRQQQGTTSETVALKVLLRHPMFWFLVASFFTCGSTAMGLVGVHLMPYAIEKGIPDMTAAVVLGVMGGMNFVGSILSGWLVDRIDPRKILAFVFTLRGFSLFLVPFIQDFSGLMVFGFIYGLNWFATVPPVMALSADTFGKQSVAKVYGWIFLGHQVGSAITATAVGYWRDTAGDYRMSFFLGGLMAVSAGGLALVSLLGSKRQLAGRASA